MLRGSIIFAALVIGVTSGLRSCDDCTAINQCPIALNEVVNNQNPETAAKIRNALCETVGIMKVCCTDFSINSRMLVDENEKNNGDEIENHPNLHLLSGECGEIEGNRIIGGQVPTLYEFPWLALISHRIGRTLKFSCGGTVISSRYVLTAAHCMKGQNIAGVRIGDYDISKKIDCFGAGEARECESKYQDIAVTHAIIHPQYSRYPFVVNDIGLLRLKKLVDFSVRNAAPICLPVFRSLRDTDISDEIGTVAGWGATENEQASTVLLKVEIPIHSDETCRVSYDRNSRPGQWSRRLKNTLCAGEVGRDSCKGDSGGPLMLEGLYNDTYKIVQYGIVSYGIECGTDTPAIYTDVRKFMKWILDTIKP
ncbi:unnamed protein product, partial [Iphiclides podalirius]